MHLDSMRTVMLAIAAARSVDEILDLIVRSIANCPNVALARIWLMTSDERSSPDRFLQLAASAGTLHSSSIDHSFHAGRFARFRPGERKVGRVAEAGEGILLSPIGEHTQWIADPVWARNEDIASFAAQPLLSRGEVLGVLGIFDRKPIPEEDFLWIRTFADHAAIALANARAFQEIESLKQRLELDNSYLRAEITAPFGEMIGTSEALRKVQRQIDVVAPTDAGVLILGESGSGKELIARALHDRSRRRERPLVKINCAAIPHELFESEFFGHMRGAFTGATSERVGRFEVADGGTLFLDEIGEIPLSHQAKLLRVLQEGTFERIGDHRPRRTDVRIIAATNRQLKQEADAGRFRIDLYYRLSVFPIEVPPLRVRTSDIEPLAHHFILQASRRMGVPAPRLTRAWMDRLIHYHWPGNVRELQHLIERAVIISRGGVLSFPDLPGDATETAPSQPAALSTQETRIFTAEDMRRLEADNIRRALQATRGRIFGPEGAALLLGMKPTTLTSRIKALGIQP